MALDPSFWLNLGMTVLGGFQQQKASRQTVQTFENEANAERVNAQYNAELSRRASNRRQRNLARHRDRAIGEQRTQMAISGLSPTSKSFLQVMNEGLDNFNQAMLEERVDFRTEEAIILREGEERAQQRLRQAQAERTKNQANLVGSALSAGESLLTISRNLPQTDRKKTLGNNIAFVKREL